MNLENALWLLDVMTAEARRLMAMVEAQNKKIAELQSQVEGYLIYGKKQEEKQEEPK